MKIIGRELIIEKKIIGILDEKRVRERDNKGKKNRQRERDKGRKTGKERELEG